METTPADTVGVIVGYLYITDFLHLRATSLDMLATLSHDVVVLCLSRDLILERGFDKLIMGPEPTMRVKVYNYYSVYWSLPQEAVAAISKVFQSWITNVTIHVVSSQTSRRRKSSVSVPAVGKLDVGERANMLKQFRRVSRSKKKEAAGTCADSAAKPVSLTTSVPSDLQMLRQLASHCLRVTVTFVRANQVVDEASNSTMLQGIAKEAVWEEEELRDFEATVKELFV